MLRSLRLLRSNQLSKTILKVKWLAVRCYELYKEYCKMLESKLDGKLLMMIL